jgi:HSP20 family protein
MRPKLRAPSFGSSGNNHAHSVEVFQDGDRLVVRADLPGLSRDDVHVEIANDRIMIQGERRQEHQERQEGYFQSEK